MIELPLLKPGLSGHLMKLIIKVKMSNKRSELFNFVSSLQSSNRIFRIEIRNISSPFFCSSLC